MLFAIAVADWSRFADPDLWGHVRFGQEVLRQGHLVWRDPYSYSAAGHLWLNHEWLSELIMGVLYNSLGVFGLKLMKFACAALTVSFIAAAESETGASPWLQFAILISAAVTMNVQMQFRPQAFTFAMLSGLIYLLARDAYRGRAPLWLAIPMLAAWANLHGGFVLGVATLAIYTIVCCAQDFAAGRGFANLMRLGSITALATLATLATPYGIGAWRAVLHALANPYTRIVVADWQNLWLSIGSRWHTEPLTVMFYEIAVLLMAALFFSFVLTPKLGDLPLVVIATVMSAAAIVSVRNVPIAVIAIAAPLARHLPAALSGGWPQLANASPTRSASRASRVIFAILAALLLVRGDFFSNRLEAGMPYPVAATEFIRQRGLHGNFLSLFSWGEYLIWHLAPNSKVFIDGRYDTMYPQNVLVEFFAFNYLQPGAQIALDNYPTEYVLIPPDLAARKLMDSRRDWRLIYRDDIALLYARADSPVAKIAGLPVAGSAKAATFP
ncbi:MAG: hypothetical protein Q7S58_09470 [Candidatus Binatus sp.]|uniref:hypothetical protein n=1 Tax=Candidatus Binatus sp. TaxID=2811406 RepID=UPI00272151F5|nr:hypothetical protein [Candidatus Binatus sp.]MDO8432625.1 hypothetical protein [Candidatus Binatus sp.]